MKKILLMAILLIATSSMVAQTVQVNGVKGRFYNGVHPIEDYGFYTIYLGEKLKKGMVQYVLEIYDLDLKLITKSTVDMTKYDNLLGAEFNGTNFMFVFYDLKKKTNSYVVFDKKGKQTAKKVMPGKKAATVGSNRIFPAKDGSGFYSTSMVKEKKWGYRIVKLSPSADVLWDKTYTRPKGVASVVYAEAGNGRLIINTSERPALTSKKVMNKLIAIDDQTGENIYEKELFNGTVTCVPSSLLIEKDGSIVTSGMYFNGEKFNPKNSDGIFFNKLDPKGKEIAFNTIDWDNGIQAALKATSRKFSIGSKPKVIMHEIVPEEGGGYQVISETFRKTLKAGSLLADRDNPATGFTIMDFIIFNYDATGNPVDINKIEKPYKSGMVYGAAAQQGGIALATMMKAAGLFTFGFTSVDPATDTRVVVFTNFEDAGLGKGKPYIGVTSITAGEESQTRKIPVTKKHTPYMSGGGDGGRAGVMEGKPGKMCLFFYNKKEKVINMTIESISM